MRGVRGREGHRGRARGPPGAGLRSHTQRLCAAQPRVCAKFASTRAFVRGRFSGVGAVGMASEASEKLAAATISSPPKLQVLFLVNGMAAADLAAVLDEAKTASKAIGTHKRRQLYWDCYTKMCAKTSSMEGAVFCFLLYRASTDVEDVDGTVEVVELTKRQRGLVGGGCDFLGHKLKHSDDPGARSWCMSFNEDDAQAAWDDLMSAEPCIFIQPDVGVFVATRWKRTLCKGLSGPLKTMKELDKVMGEIGPTLKSVSFVGNEPPAVNSYNTFVVAAKPPADLPPTIGHLAAASGAPPEEVYGYFQGRKNAHLIGEAGKLIGQMLADVNKGLTPLVVASSQKDAAIAYKNALMRRVYVHESMKKFVDRVRKDGQVELWEIKGDVEDTDFGKYGKLVFELYYRVDLSTF